MSRQPDFFNQVTRKANLDSRQMTYMQEMQDVLKEVLEDTAPSNPFLPTVYYL
jgi:hypothetical protein